MNAKTPASATNAKPVKTSKVEAIKLHARDTLYNLQFKQLRHDEIYHSDICLLRIQARIAHHTLHLGKYSGKMAAALIAAPSKSNDAALTATILDAIIIVMSSANTLNMPLWEMETAVDDLVGAIHGVQLEGEAKVHAIGYVVVVGKLAKAVEALDHVEALDSRSAYEKALRSCWLLLLKFWRTMTNQKIGEALRARMYVIESKNMFYGRLPSYENDYQVAVQA
jgi:hypothetical protein